MLQQIAIVIDVLAYALRVQRNYVEPRVRMKDGKPICIPMLRPGILPAGR